MARTGEAYRAAERALWRLEGAEPEDRTLDLPRTKARVRVQMLGAGDPVLFVHGASNGGTSWASLAARMEGFRCILLDRPGCGLSAPVSQPFADVTTLGRFAEALLVDVLDALAIERAHLVATSYGGYFALRTAAAHPDRVGRGVEMGWTVGAPMVRTPLVMRLGSVPAIGRAMSHLRLNDRMARTMLAQVGLRQALTAGRVPREAVDVFRLLVNDTTTMRNEIAGAPPVMDLRGINASILLADEILAGVRAPFLFLWGEDDVMGGGAIARAFVPRVPGAQLAMIDGAGHAVWMDDVDDIAQRTSAFLTA